MISSYADFITLIAPYLLPAGMFTVAIIIMISMVKDSIKEFKEWCSK